MKKIYSIIPLALFTLIVGCTNANDHADSLTGFIKQTDSIAKLPVLNEDTNVTVSRKSADSNLYSQSEIIKLFKKRIELSPTDSIITYKLVTPVADKNAIKWIVPAKKDLIKIISTFYEFSGSDWAECYGDWSYGVEGKIYFKSSTYNYRLDAGGWIIIFNEKVQRYFGCKNKDCSKNFPNDCYCDENGSIDQP